MKNKKILIVDDDRNMTAALKRVLKTFHFQCTTCDSAIEGLKKAEQINPHLILLDMNMPLMSGLGFLNEIKRNAKLSHIPIVVLSGENDKDTAQEAMNRGASGYLVKNYMREDLLGMIQSYLK